MRNLLLIISLMYKHFLILRNPSPRCSVYTAEGLAHDR